MAMNLKFLLPEEWQELDKKKKYNMLTRLFITHSNIPMYENKKLSSSFTRIRLFFSRQKEIKSVYAFLYQTDKIFNNLTEMYQERNKWWEEQKFKSKTEVEQYKPIGLEEILDL